VLAMREVCRAATQEPKLRLLGYESLAFPFPETPVAHRETGPVSRNTIEASVADPDGRRLKSFPGHRSRPPPRALNWPGHGVRVVAPCGWRFGGKASLTEEIVVSVSPVHLGRAVRWTATGWEKLTSRVTVRLNRRRGTRASTRWPHPRLAAGQGELRRGQHQWGFRSTRRPGRVPLSRPGRVGRSHYEAD